MSEKLNCLTVTLRLTSDWGPALAPSLLTDIHVPSDLLKFISLCVLLAEEHGISGWRQHAHLLKNAKKLNRKINRIAAKNGPNFKTRLQPSISRMTVENGTFDAAISKCLAVDWPFRGGRRDCRRRERWFQASRESPAEGAGARNAAARGWRRTTGRRQSECRHSRQRECGLRGEEPFRKCFWRHFCRRNGRSPANTMVRRCFTISGSGQGFWIVRCTNSMAMPSAGIGRLRSGRGSTTGSAHIWRVVHQADRTVQMSSQFC